MNEPTIEEISVDWKWRQSLIDAEYDFTGSNHLAEAHRHLKIALDRLEDLAKHAAHETDELRTALNRSKS